MMLDDNVLGPLTWKRQRRSQALRSLSQYVGVRSDDNQAAQIFTVCATQKIGRHCRGFPEAHWCFAGHHRRVNA
jgi:hypothetical protein